MTESNSAQDKPADVIFAPTREELLEMAVNELAKPIPSTKGLDPKARALRLHAELWRRISLANEVLKR